MKRRSLFMVLLCFTISVSRRFDDPSGKYCPPGKFAYAMRVNEDRDTRAHLGLTFYCGYIALRLRGGDNAVSDNTPRIEHFEGQSIPWKGTDIVHCPRDTIIMGIESREMGARLTVIATCGTPFDSNQNRTFVADGIVQGTLSKLSSQCDQTLAMCGMKRKSMHQYEAMCCNYFENNTVGYEFEEVYRMNNKEGTQEAQSRYHISYEYYKGQGAQEPVPDLEMKTVAHWIRGRVSGAGHELVEKINADPRMGEKKLTFGDLYYEVDEALRTPTKGTFHLSTAPGIFTKILQLTIYVGEHRIRMKNLIQFNNGKQVPNTFTGGGAQQLSFFSFLAMNLCMIYGLL